MQKAQCVVLGLRAQIFLSGLQEDRSWLASLQVHYLAHCMDTMSAKSVYATRASGPELNKMHG